PGPDGNIWFTEAGRGRIGKVNPKTGQVAEYQNTPTADGKKTTAHTVRMDAQGMVWATGGPAITSFDPKTNEFKHYDLGGTYGVTLAANGDVWFTSFVAAGPIARISKDGKLSKFYPPTKGKPQRLELDKDGNVWFTERERDKLGRFDPKTETVTEYPFPQSEISMREFFLDSKGRMWFGSSDNNKVGYFYFQ